MEYTSIERELHIDAAPEVVYAVVSSPEHLREWWPDHAELDLVPGGTGSITFGEPGSPQAKTETLSVVAADAPRRFSFRWVGEPGEPAAAGNSLLVTFDLIAVGAGTLLRFSETGFRERGWESDVLHDTYAEHAQGWEFFLPRLLTYAGRLVTRP